jgi:hypothetical protein
LDVFNFSFTRTYFFSNHQPSDDNVHEIENFGENLQGHKSTIEFNAESEL